jgi:hypothetical protein
MLYFRFSSSAKMRPYLKTDQKYGSQKMPNRDGREDEGEHYTPLLQLPPSCSDWCGVWRCHAGGINSSSCFIKNFELFLLL